MVLDDLLAVIKFGGALACRHPAPMAPTRGTRGKVDGDGARSTRHALPPPRALTSVRCLVVSPDPTHPQDDDERVRAHALLSRLKAFGHEVDLVLAPRGRLDADGARLMRSAWDRVVVVPFVQDEEPPADATPTLDEWFPPALDAALPDVLARQIYDVVIVRHLHLSRALVPAGTLKVLHLSDGPTGEDGTGATGLRVSRNDEAHGLDRADLVLAPDDDARAALQALTRAFVATVGAAPPIAARPASAPGFRIGLTGSADAGSVAAVSRFLAASDLDRLAAREGVLRVSGRARVLAAQRGAHRDGGAPARAVPRPRRAVRLPEPAEGARHRRRRAGTGWRAPPRCASRARRNDG